MTTELEARLNDLAACVERGATFRHLNGIWRECADALANYREQLDEARAELERWATWGTIEVAIRNPNVASYIEHWEKRALSAEADRDALRAAIEKHNTRCRIMNDCEDDGRPLSFVIPLPPAAAAPSREAAIEQRDAALTEIVRLNEAAAPDAETVAAIEIFRAQRRADRAAPEAGEVKP